LAACDGEPVAPNQAQAVVDTPQQAAGETPTDEAPAPTHGDWPVEFYDTDNSSLTPQEIVGMWSIAPNCAQPKVFMADGAYTDQTGFTGRWTLDNDRLSLVARRDTTVNEVNQFDDNTFAAGALSTPINPGVIRTFVIYRRC
jgi:hypothetical protein